MAKSYIILRNPTLSHIYRFDNKEIAINFALIIICTYIIQSMKSRNKEPDIKPDQLYSAGQAAKYFGVHRCTVYDYVNNPDNPLSYLLAGHSSRFMFLGQMENPGSDDPLGQG